jgi:hypothetical protein
MIRESDEECLALIATIRDRAQRLVIDGTHAQMYGTHNEIDRLLDNLEARIKEAQLQAVSARLEIEARVAMQHREDRARAYEGGYAAGLQRHARDAAYGDEMRIDRECCQAENARLRGQLADLGHEFVKLTGEIERLHTECDEKDIVLSCSSLRAPKDAEPERRVHLTEDCPCGTESCREAWRELRQAQGEAVVEKVEGAYRLGYETRLKHETRSDRLVMDECAKQAKADAAREQAQLIEKHGSEFGAIRFREIIREEVAKATAESSREIAVQLIALAERLAAVELHEAANQPGEPSFRLRTVLREEVAAEVERQLGVTLDTRQLANARFDCNRFREAFEAFRAALEAETS